MGVSEAAALSSKKSLLSLAQPFRLAEANSRGLDLFPLRSNDLLQEIGKYHVALGIANAYLANQVRMINALFW